MDKEANYEAMQDAFGRLYELLKEASEHVSGCHDCIFLTGGDLQQRIDAALAAPFRKTGV